MTSRPRSFTSDNNSGACPEVLAAISAANPGHVPAYGSDDVTDHLQTLVRAEFGPQAEAFPIFNGTGGNVVALGAACRAWDAVICTELAHINATAAAIRSKTPPTTSRRRISPRRTRSAHVSLPNTTRRSVMIDQVYDFWIH